MRIEPVRSKSDGVFKMDHDLFVTLFSICSDCQYIFVDRLFRIPSQSFIDNYCDVFRCEPVNLVVLAASMVCDRRPNVRRSALFLSVL